MARSNQLLVLASIVILFLTTAIAEASDWPQWQGPNRDGKSAETGLLKQWPENGPPLAWRIDKLGGGDSAPAVAGGRIYLMANRGEEEVVWALSEKDGSEIWAIPLGPAVQQRASQGKEGPGCTPTVDGERLYVEGLGGNVACLRARDGKIVWQISMTEKFGGSVPRWSYRESPLVDGDKVICTPGGPDATLVALNKLTGETIWKTKMPDPAAEASASGGSPGGSGSASGARGSRGREGREQTRETPAASRARPVIVIPAGSKWKFLDTGVSPGADWTKLDFEDEAWREGPAQLGYGDDDEKTKLNDSRDNYPTYYFRLKFEVEDPAKLKPLVLRLIRDDGAIVFINGREILRDNVPTGSVNRETYAASVTSVENGFHVHDIAADRLATGKNVIAVAVHQASATSSDVSFDLELREKIPGDVVGPPREERRFSFGRGGGGRFGGGRGGSRGATAAYASPIAIDFEGQRQYVQLISNALVGFAASDGKFLWRYDKPANRMGINCSTAIYHEGHVFAASAYGAGGGLVRLSKNADGAVKAEEVYATADMENHHGGMILLDGYLYGANGGNSGGALACLEFKTGKVMWDQRESAGRRAKGSLALADGRLYYRMEDGTVVLIEPNSQEYVERGRFEQPDRTRLPAWSHPVIANGKLYVRDQDVLFCYDVKAK